MSGPDDGWASTVSTWAHARPDIRALVQIGSRVQEGAPADRWSDYDYQIITSDPAKYRDGSFCRDLGTCWAFGAQVAFGGAVKVTGVYSGALEADFVVLTNWEVRVAFAAAAWPATSRLWPRILRQGVADLRIVAAPGWRVIKGGKAWEERYRRLAPLRAPLTEDEFKSICGEFWTQLVWAAKRTGRGEFRAAQRALHLHLVEGSLRMLQEEALLDGRRAYPLGRRAELWLGAEELKSTGFGAAPDRDSLHAALVRIMEIFDKSSAAVAGKNGWDARRHAEVREWLGSLAGPRG